MTYPMLGRQKQSLLPCLPRFTCPPSSGAASPSSVRAQSKSLEGLPDHLAKAYPAQMPLGFGRWASQLSFYSAIALQSNLLPPEIGGVNQNGTKRRKVKDTRQHQHSNKYCSSQIGITFCLGCIELDLAR